MTCCDRCGGALAPGAPGPCPACGAPVGTVPRRGTDISGAVDLGGIVLGSTRPDAPADDPDPGVFFTPKEEAFGRYRLLETLGEGGMGRVYLAEDPELGRNVALKVMLSGFAGREEWERFHREARALARLGHPHIVQVFDIGREKEQPYFTMEHVDGPSLARRIDEGLSIDEGIGILVKVCRAVQHAHSAGVIHRDLKPTNILLDSGGEPRVLDFGLAKTGEPGGPQISQSGARLGTPAYMSPEQAKGKIREIDERTDVWSLGTILFEIATGGQAYSGDEYEVLTRILSGDPPRVSEVNPDAPRAVDAIAARAMAWEKEGRYRTAAELADDLERYLAGAPVVARPLSLAGKWRRWARRRRKRLLALALVLLAAGGTWFARFRVEQAEESSSHEAQAAARTEERRRRIADLVARAASLEERMDGAVREEASLATFDAIQADLARILGEADLLRSEPGETFPPPVSPARENRWREDLEYWIGRAIVEGRRAERYDEARGLLGGRMRAEGGPHAEDARFMLGRLELDSLPAPISRWPDLDRQDPLSEEERTRLGVVADLLDAYGTAAVPDAHAIRIGRARILLHLGRAGEAARALESLVPQLRQWAESRDRGVAAFDLLQGLVLAASLQDPPDLPAIENWYDQALALLLDPDLEVDPSWIVAPAHSASLVHWRRWLQTGSREDLAIVRERLGRAHEVSNYKDWPADLPWMLGVSLLVTGETPADREKGRDCLADAVKMGYLAREEARYHETEALRDDPAFLASLRAALSGER